MTTVVNIHRREAYDEYIGRAGRGETGYFGNPIRLEAGQSRNTVLEKYKEYLLDRMEKDLEFRSRIEGLRGKRLGCFCAPAECHGMVIVEVLDGTPILEQVKRYKESMGKPELPQCFD